MTGGGVHRGLPQGTGPPVGEGVGGCTIQGLTLVTQRLPPGETPVSCGYTVPGGPSNMRYTMTSIGVDPLRSA